MLTAKEKELVFFGASVAAGCKPCMNYHIKQLRVAGAEDEEIEQVIDDASRVRRCAQETMEGHGRELLGIASEGGKRDSGEAPTRIRELVCTAAAFALNCTSSLEKHIAEARAVGISDDEIASVLDAALLVKGRAALYVDRIGQLKREVDQLQRMLDELQETQAQLVQAEKMAALGKLVAGMVHEMNTPVGVINSATDVVSRSIAGVQEALRTSRTLDELRDNRRFQGALKALQNGIPTTSAASERIVRIIGSLKSFARLDEAPFQKADLHEGLDSALTLIEPEFRGRIAVVREYGDLPRLACYPAELNQVFFNLLTNAAQAIRGEGAITIRTSVEDGKAHVRIADTGTGIPPEQMQELFVPGFSKEGPRVRTGLGLFVSFNIVQKHRGEIKVESELGKGSAFTVLLPLDLESAPAEESSP